MQPFAVQECSDKLALLNFAVYNIRQMKNSGMDEESIRQILTEQFGFSELLMDQIIS